jgi:hypothetical protein
VIVGDGNAFGKRRVGNQEVVEFFNAAVHRFGKSKSYELLPKTYCYFPLKNES